MSYFHLYISEYILYSMLFNMYIDGIVSHTWAETAVPPPGTIVLADDISDGQRRVLPLATIPFPDVRVRLQMTYEFIYTNFVHVLTRC